MTRHYWESEKVTLRTERKKYARGKWKEYADTESREMLQNIVELPPIAFTEFEKKFVDCKEVDPNSSQITLYIEDKDDRLTGWIKVANIDRKNGTFGIALGVFSDFQKHGYGSDAFSMMLEYCFNELRLNKCNNACIDYNHGSISLHKKFGFIEEGRRRESIYMHGRYHDEILFGLTAAKFNENKSRSPGTG